MRERFKLPIAVFILFFKEDQILLLKRSNTGYKDGFYSIPAGGLEDGETIEYAAIREASEEVGVDIISLDLVHTMHCHTNNENWIGFYFKAHEWKGELKINEPHKHSEVVFIPINSLPSNLIGYVEQAIKSVNDKKHYSIYK